MLTRTAWRVGATNALICGVGLFAVWCGLVGGVALVSGRTLAASAGPAWTLLWVAILLQYGAFRFFERRMGGRILLDCGPGPVRGLGLLLAAFLFIQGCLTVFASREVPWWEFSAVAFYVSMALGRLQIKENGIWEYGGLLRWNRIVSYRWADDGTLVLRAKGYLTMPRGALPVPPQHKESINAFLLERAPQARES